MDVYAAPKLLNTPKQCFDALSGQNEKKNPTVFRAPECIDGCFSTLNCYFFFSIVLRVSTFYLFLVKLSITREKHSRFVMKSVKENQTFTLKKKQRLGLSCCCR